MHALRPLLPLASALALVLASGCATLPALGSGASMEHQHDMAGMDMAGADTAAMHGGMAGDAHDAQLGMERPRFPPAQGSVPTQDEASRLPQLSSITITNDTKFNPSHGVRSGSGTLADPYRITGYDITGDVFIGDTDACFEVADNWIDGQLRLDWNGPCVFVHHNYVRDLRVNENIARVGLDTGGLIELNTINYVGQIRHYDGEFRDNVVGPRDDKALPYGVFDDPENQLPFATDTRVLNIDGFNEGLFHHNTVTGSVDLKLHGHHHSTGFLATHSHYHGDNQTLLAAMAHDHTNRWESVSFTDNKVVDPTGYGLRYTDENHAGDDRTAASETTKQLDDPHQHHTVVDISRNLVQGAGLWVDIFNADDELHAKRDPGWLTLADNTIEVQQRDPGALGLVPVNLGQPAYQPLVGLWVMTAKEVQLTITGNTLRFTARPDSPTSTLANLEDQVLPRGEAKPTAILLAGVRDSNVTVAGNHGEGFALGIVARGLDKKVQWAVYGDDFPGAAQALYYDDSVVNHPSDKPLPPGPAWQDDMPPASAHKH